MQDSDRKDDDRNMERHTGDFKDLYDAGLNDGRDEVLERVRKVLSTPGMSGADVYETLAQFCDTEGFKVYDYDDPDNPYASEA